MGRDFSLSRTPGKNGESKNWYAQLTLELQTLARKSGDYTSDNPAVWKALLDTWDEIDETP
ncbi:MAG: hypothetical protein ACI9R3_002558 [Verrucomicrobiales bacterium]|jgi:hypothetical protein